MSLTSKLAEHTGGAFFNHQVNLLIGALYILYGPGSKELGFDVKGQQCCRPASSSAQSHQPFCYSLHYNSLICNSFNVPV